MNGPIKKTIHTELYSDKAYSIILGFYYGLDDWGSKQMARNSGYCDVERAPDNEVVLTIKCNDPYAYAWRKSAFNKHQTDQDTRNWMAWIIKQLVRKDIREAGDDESAEWNRSNDRVAHELFVKGFEETLNRLEPTKILLYGSTENLDTHGVEIIHIPHHYDQRRLNKKLAECQKQMELTKL